MTSLIDAVSADAYEAQTPRSRLLAALPRARTRHIVSSAIGTAFWFAFAAANIRASIESGRVIGLGVGVLGIWSAVLFSIRRPPTRVSSSAAVWFVAYLGAFGGSALRPGGADVGSLDVIGLILQFLALSVGAVGLAALGRSLGLVPAHRGLVTTGAYRVIRHPLYASYFMAELGYLLQSPRLWNVAVLAVVWACQVARIVSEENLLAVDDAYRAYALKTRWRLIPGLW